VRPRSSVLIAWLAGCSAKPLTGEDVCEDVVIAVAARVAACAGDSAVAAEVRDSFDDLDCLLESADSGTVDAGFRAWYACPEAIGAVPCDAALDNAEDPAFWLGQEFHCASIWGAESDTGASP
jgi:hypothetical protein